MSRFIPVKLVLGTGRLMETFNGDTPPSTLRFLRQVSNSNAFTKWRVADPKIHSVYEDKGKKRSEAKDGLKTNGDENSTKSNERSLIDLNVFPMQYASPETVHKIRQRGKTFWKCRVRSYVSYQDRELESIQNLVGPLQCRDPTRLPVLRKIYRQRSDT